MNDIDYMKQALELAKAAAGAGEVPVGAIVVKDGEIIGQGYNNRESKNLSTAHAEVIAIEEACRKMGAWRLNGCTVYVTLEPCIMCAGLMHQARIDRCVFGAYDEKAGALGTLYKVNEDARLNHNFEVIGGVMQDECAEILSNFFKNKR